MADRDALDNEDSKKVADFLEIYDLVASRYPYTLRGFYTLTLRQIHLLSRKSVEKQQEEIRIEAAIHGIKMPDHNEANDLGATSNKEFKAREAKLNAAEASVLAALRKRAEKMQGLEKKDNG